MENVCCCFGHREVYKNIDKELYSVLEDQIINKNIQIFLTGGMGEFDRRYAEAVNRLKKKYPKVRLILVIPYITENINKSREYYEWIYDDIIYPEVVAGVYPLSAIELRNRWMVEKSDTVIVYVNREFGGAYKTMMYARRLNKDIIKL